MKPEAFFQSPDVATTLNPYQGLKLTLSGLPLILMPGGCNDIESLSGIETKDWDFQPKLSFGCNDIESLSGIET